MPEVTLLCSGPCRVATKTLCYTMGGKERERERERERKLVKRVRRG
jgi:hypothetical protein